jgi:ribosomal protein S18 acetylase RimI-like enzyme
MTAPRRPATARPRDDFVPEASAPPTRAELDAIERQQATLAVYSGARLVESAELGALLVSRPGLGPALNYATTIRWPRDRAGESLTRLEQHFAAHGEWPSIVVSEGLTEPAALAETLAASGWKMLLGERVLYTRHPPTVPHLDPSLRVEAVARASTTECVALETEVFGLSAEQQAERAEQLAAGIERGELRALAVRLRGEIVASARLVADRRARIAGLYGIGVASAHRRRGYGSLVTAIATRAGLATGQRLIWLSVDEGNTPATEMYARLGYVPSFSWTRWLAQQR